MVMCTFALPYPLLRNQCKFPVSFTASHCSCLLVPVLMQNFDPTASFWNYYVETLFHIQWNLSKPITFGPKFLGLNV